MSQRRSRGTWLLLQKTSTALPSITLEVPACLTKHSKKRKKYRLSVITNIHHNNYKNNFSISREIGLAVKPGISLN